MSSKYSIINYRNDVEILKKNLNFNLNKYNSILTTRKRKIDFKAMYYFLIKYNMNSKSSYNTTIIDIFNNQESADITYQSFINKRNNIDISIFQTINDDLIKSLYKHINQNENKNNNYTFKIGNNTYRLKACDGSQLIFLHSLNNHFKSNKNNTYTYTTLSCLFDIELKIPINYMLSNSDERSILINQFDYLDNNDILVTDRGYYSENLINKLNEKKINYVLRITKKNIHYINNINNINKLKSGSIDINNNLKLFWFKTRDGVDKDISKILDTITNNNNKICEYSKIIKKLKIQYDKLYSHNKELIIQINNKSDVNNKSLNKILMTNRIKKNDINELIKLNKDKINLLREDLKKLYDEKMEIELDNNSSYFIISNLKLLELDQVKYIYKKRWEVETHFRYAKESFKFDSMNNKNYEYIKQNILITQYIFLISGYIQYILNKKIDDSRMLNNSCIFTSLKNKLIYYLLNENINNRDERIITLLTKLTNYTIKKIITIKYIKRERKRPPKTNYCDLNKLS